MAGADEGLSRHRRRSLRPLPAAGRSSAGAARRRKSCAPSITPLLLPQLVPMEMGEALCWKDCEGTNRFAATARDAPETNCLCPPAVVRKDDEVVVPVQVRLGGSTVYQYRYNTCSSRTGDGRSKSLGRSAILVLLVLLLVG